MALYMKSNTLPWIEKYRPSSLSDVSGHYDSIFALSGWAVAWDDNADVEKKAVILYGTAGVGKTSTAIALANEMNWNLLELNASDVRNAKSIKKIVGSASDSGDLSEGNTLILLDEADNLHGNSDRGGIKAIIDVIKTTKQPIILIVNDFYKIPYALKSICECLEFAKIGKVSMMSVLGKICDNENITVGFGALEKIIDNANGDLRTAVGDLQSSVSDKNSLSKNNLVLSESDEKENVFKVMQAIFRAPNVLEAYKVAGKSDKNPEELVQWVDQNLGIEFGVGSELLDAYESISKADLFLGRTKRRQNYKLWKYASVIMSCNINNISNNRSSIHRGFIRYESPKHWKLMSSSKVKRKNMKSCIEKIGKYCHVSQNYVSSELLEFFKFLMKERSVKLSADLELDKNDINFLTDNKLAKNDVELIYKSAQDYIKLQEAEVISKDINSTFDAKDIIGNKDGKFNKTKEDKKKEKLSRGQFTFDSF